MKKELCPAWGKTCAACGERNHFKASKKCKHQGVNSLADDYSSDSSESSTGTISTVTAFEDQVVNSVNPGNQLIFCEMEINKRPVRMQIDCGATVCILPKHYLGISTLFVLRGFIFRCGTKRLYLPLASVRSKSRTPPLRRSTRWTLSLLTTTSHLSSAVLLHRR